MKNKLNRLLTVSIIAAAVAMGSFTHASAQSSGTNSLPASSFATSAMNYFTSFDTNSTTFQTERGEFWTGIDQGNNTLSAIVGLTYDPSASFTCEAMFENANVNGTVLSAQIGGGYRIVHYDTQLTAGIDAGYRLDTSHPFIEPFLDARKALTQNTFAGVRLTYQQTFSGSTGAHPPGVMFISGFKF